MQTAKYVEPVRLLYRERDRRTIIEPNDEDRFTLSVNEAIQACRIYGQWAEFHKQYDLLLTHLGQWLHVRKSQVDKAFLTVRDAGLLLLIVTKAATYDSQFESELVDLDIEVARDSKFDLVPLSVLALPHCHADGYNSFCGASNTLEYKL
jgi:hypothetical protein